MSGSQFGRRTFLKTSAATAGGWALSQITGCSSIDRLFGPDQGLYDNEVLIIGAGAAGLMAAHELKKKQIPYRVIEAASRFGGRVRTLSRFNSDQQFAELGAEFIDGRHETVFSLCKELNLPLDSVPDRPDQGLFITDNRLPVPRPDLLRDLQPLLSKLVRLRLQITGDDDQPLSAFIAGANEDAARLDQVSADALINQLGVNVSPRGLSFLRQALQVQFGVAAEHQSSLHLLMSLDPEVRSSGIYRVRGGTSTLTQALYERINGVLPEFFVRFETKLLSVRDLGDSFELRVSTPKGRQTLRARYVIFALPPAALRQVDGWKDLKISTSRHEAIKNIKFAHHSRTVLSFRDRFWQSKFEAMPGMASLIGNVVLQSGWDSSRGQNGRAGLFTWTTAGQAGQEVGASAPNQSLQDMEKLWKTKNLPFDGQSVVQNWSRQAGLDGSVTVYAPGEFSRYNGVFLEGDYKGRLAFAGEHTSPGFHGTLQGAVESGRRAADQIIKAMAEAAVNKL